MREGKLVASHHETATDTHFVLIGRSSVWFKRLWKMRSEQLNESSAGSGAPE